MTTFKEKSQDTLGARYTILGESNDTTKMQMMLSEKRLKRSRLKMTPLRRVFCRLRQAKQRPLLKRLRLQLLMRHTVSGSIEKGSRPCEKMFGNDDNIGVRQLRRYLALNHYKSISEYLSIKQCNLRMRTATTLQLYL